MEITDVKMHYSGGIGNSDPTLSVSGDIGDETNGSLDTIDLPNPITGVYIFTASNINGPVTVTYTALNEIITFVYNGQSIQYNMNVALRATIEINFSNSNAYLTISYIGPDLPTSDVALQTINITCLKNQLWLDISTQESLSGKTDYYLYYIKNSHATDSCVLKQIATSATGASPAALTISIGNQTNVMNELPDAGHVADPSTAPSYATIKNILAGATMLAGDKYYFWLKRSIPNLNAITNLNSRGGIKIGIDI